MYSLPSFLLPFFMASSTTLSLKSIRAGHPLRHLRFLACMRHRVRIPPVHLRMRCTTICDHAHRGEVSLSVRLILCKIRNILSIRRTLDISSKNRCFNCDLYSGKYGNYWQLRDLRLPRQRFFHHNFFNQCTIQKYMVAKDFIKL